MKKMHTWANAIPKTRREKDVLRLTKNPAEFKRMMNLLETATKVTNNIQKFENEKFKTAEEAIAFVSCRISEDMPARDIFLEELNCVLERYEDRKLSREGSGQDPRV